MTPPEVKDLLVMFGVFLALVVPAGLIWVACVAQDSLHHWVDRQIAEDESAAKDEPASGEDTQ